MADPYIISVLGQKGGVGKSTIARMLGEQFARMDDGGWEVKIADLDVAQSTSWNWMRRRAANGYTPAIRVETMTLDKALKDARFFHVMILDCPGFATRDPLQAATASKLVVVPSCIGTDDLEPTVRVLHDLKKGGVEKQRIVVLLTKVGDSAVEIQQARDYFEEAVYYVANTTLKDATLYRRALDVGQTLTEVKHKGLADRARQVFVELIERLTQAEPASKKENAA